MRRGHSDSVALQITVGPDAAIWFAEAGANKLGRLQIPGVHGRGQLMASTGPGTSASFTVSFSSSAPGQGEVYFGTSCSGLVEVANQDLRPGTTSHTVVVTGNDLAGTVGDIGIQPGTTYSYEAVTVTSSGQQLDNNGGKCYSVTVPST